MKQIQEMKATNKVTQVKAGYLFAQSAKLSDQLEAVEAVFTSLASLTPLIHLSLKFGD